GIRVRNVTGVQSCALPIFIFGVYLFSRFQRESFSKYVYIALYGTALSPMITEVALQFGNYWQKLLAVMLCGIIIGFMLPPLATLLGSASCRVRLLIHVVYW